MKTKTDGISYQMWGRCGDGPLFKVGDPASDPVEVDRLERDAKRRTEESTEGFRYWIQGAQ